VSDWLAGVREAIDTERDQRQWTIPMWEEKYGDDWPAAISRVRAAADQAVEALLEAVSLPDSVGVKRP